VIRPAAIPRHNQKNTRWRNGANGEAGAGGEAIVTDSAFSLR
jgi:hypothetical protein